MIAHCATGHSVSQMNAKEQIHGSNTLLQEWLRLPNVLVFQKGSILVAMFKTSIPRGVP